MISVWSFSGVFGFGFGFQFKTETKLSLIYCDVSVYVPKYSMIHINSESLAKCCPCCLSVTVPT